MDTILVEEKIATEEATTEAVVTTLTLQEEEVLVNSSLEVPVLVQGRCVRYVVVTVTQLPSATTGSIKTMPVKTQFTMR